MVGASEWVFYFLPRSDNRWLSLVYYVVNLWEKLAYWLGIWIYRIVTFPQLGEKYTDFLTNWTDTMICTFYMSTFTVMCISRYTNNLRPNDPAPWCLYFIQIVFEICLTAAVLGMGIKVLFVRIKKAQEQRFGQSGLFESHFRSFWKLFQNRNFNPWLQWSLLYGFRLWLTQPLKTTMAIRHGPSNPRICRY